MLRGAGRLRADVAFVVLCCVSLLCLCDNRVRSGCVCLLCAIYNYVPCEFLVSVAHGDLGLIRADVHILCVVCSREIFPLSV